MTMSEYSPSLVSLCTVFGGTQMMRCGANAMAVSRAVSVPLPER
ncbi:MAG: hypothetical protein AABZ39_13050 [Spirochaetota bacterium]